MVFKTWSVTVAHLSIMSTKHHLAEWIRHIRHHEKQQELELELRIGTFQNNQFDAGINDYKAENTNQALQNVLTFVDHITQQFDTLSHSNNARWSRVVRSVMQRANYQGDVRHTVSKDDETYMVKKDYMKKTTKKQMNIKTSRLFDVRASLCHEEPLVMEDEKSALVQMIKKFPPSSVQPMHRTSIWELIQLGQNQYVTLRYDMTKRSPPSTTKIESHKVPCNYEIEMELDISPQAYQRFQKPASFKPLQDRKQEEAENKRLAEIMWEKFSILLGTHMKDGTPLEEQKEVVLQMKEF